MKIVTYDSVSDLEHDAFRLLREHLGQVCNRPHAVMLTGGRTPLGIYRKISQSAPRVDPSLRLLITDERHVATESADSNFGHMRSMVGSLGLDDAHIMRVHTELPLVAAADRYHEELSCFLHAGGQITLGLLGLGADGHVASLFEMDDLVRGRGRLAIAVRRTVGPNRISVTRDLLVTAQRLVFLVTGEEKTAIVEKIRTKPEDVVAAQAVSGAANVELWFAGPRHGAH